MRKQSDFIARQKSCNKDWTHNDFHIELFYIAVYVTFSAVNFVYFDINDSAIQLSLPTIS